MLTVIIRANIFLLHYTFIFTQLLSQGSLSRSFTETKLIVEFGLFDCLEGADSFIPQMKETDFASQNTQGKSTFLKKSGFFLTWHLSFRSHKRSTFHFYTVSARFKVGSKVIVQNDQTAQEMKSICSLLRCPQELSVFIWHSLCIRSGIEIPYVSTQNRTQAFSFV